jgi:hypothetical protein
MTMKKYLLIACVGVMSLASCSKTFLSEVVPANGDLDPGIIFGSKTGADNAMTGIYYLMRNYATGQQNMYGLKTIQFNFDIRGNDIISDPGNWWLYENNWSDNGYGRVATSSRNLQIWNLFYKVINNANAVIKGAAGLPESQAVKDQYIAEARALRAFAYFNLVRIYAFTYAKDINAPSVPLYTEPTTIETSGNPRAPLKDVYTQIVSDLEYAAATMTTARIDKYRFNKNVVQGVLANVYLEMAPADATLWAKANTNAAAAATGFPLNAAAYKNGFNNVTTNEWIWGLQFNASQSLSYASFFGYIEPVNSPNASFKARYNDIYINTTFVNLFTATDVRNTFIAAPSQSTANPWKKWVTTKFQDNASQTGDFVMMRSAEMVLIQAEALAQTPGQLEAAKDKLFTLQSNRDAAAVRSTAATQAALIAEILVERRKELYAETGAPYFDMKRYQLPLVRDGNQWALLNIPATDNRWRWQLPQSEMDTNKKLVAADQNPL